MTKLLCLLALKHSCSHASWKHRCYRHSYTHSQEKVLQIWCYLQVLSSQHKSISAIQMTWLYKWEIYNWLHKSRFGPRFLSLNSILLYCKPSQQMKFSYCDTFLLIWESHVLSFCDWIMLAAEFVNLLTFLVTPMSAEKESCKRALEETRHCGRKESLFCREVVFWLE